MTTHLSVFAEYREYLLSVAQRILGGRTDAEDLLQETFIRWQQTALVEIRSPKAFLATVVKRLCLNHLQSAQVRREVNVEPDGSEPALSENAFERYALASLSALTILLERLSPKERAVLLLRDVFDCDYDEIASVISNRADTCRQLLRRARQHLADARTRFEVSPEQLKKLARQFALTSASGDLQGLVTALA
ncbi:MAG TPA: sigma-70 family RNA polymerase sigma factor [Pyrinomonadaceae bacterium]